jgi:hypothetical protein
MAKAGQIDCVEASDSDYLVHGVSLLFDGYNGTGAASVDAAAFRRAVICEVENKTTQDVLKMNDELYTYAVTIWVSLRQTDYCHIMNVSIKSADEWLKSLLPRHLRDYTSLLVSAAASVEARATENHSHVLQKLMDGMLNFHHSLVLELCSDSEGDK